MLLKGKRRGLRICYSPSQYYNAPTVCEYIFFKENYLAESDGNLFCIGFMVWMGNIWPLAKPAEFNIKENEKQKQLHRDTATEV